MRKLVMAMVTGLLVYGMAGGAFAQDANSAAKADAGGYDIFILMGQSNADGRGGVAALPPELAGTSKDHIIFYSNGLASTPTWEPLAPGYTAQGNGAKLPGRGFGMEVSFAPAIASAIPGMKVAFIKTARGSTSLIFHWKAGTDANGIKAKHWQEGPGPCYRTTLDAVNEAVAKLPPGEHRLRGILWHQGESDASDRNYDKNLARLIGRLREDLKAPDLPFVFGGLRPGIGEKWNGIAVRAVDLLPNVVFVSSEGLEGDSLHFNSPALVEFGKRYADGIAPLLKKAKPTIIKGGTENYSLRNPALVEKAHAAWKTGGNETKAAGEAERSEPEGQPLPPSQEVESVKK